MAMNRLANLPIKHKLTVITLGITFVALLIMWSAFVTSEYFSKRTALVEKGMSLTRILAVNSTAAIAFDDAQTAAEVLGALKEVPIALTATIYGLKGQPFAVYSNLHGVISPWPESQVGLADIQPLRFDDTSFNRNKLTTDQLEVYQDIKESGRLIGYIKVTFSQENLKRSQNKLVLIGLLSALVAMLLTFFFATKLQKLITYPIEILANTMAHVSDKKDYSHRAEKYSNDELGKLTDGFNTMLEQIESRDAELEKSKALAEEASQTKTLFLSRMSHELRTPLNAIIGFSQLLQSTHGADATDNERKATEHILLAGRHLLMLINDIMDIVNFEQRAVEINLQDCPLNKSIEESLSLVHSVAEKSNITLHADHTALCIRANHDRLKQVLVNLLTNAIKYNRPDGRVNIKVCELAGDLVDIRVEDSGVGIDSKDFEAIFEPFTRLTYAEYHEIQGTGIGLALSKFLVQQMQGEITIESECDVGTTFHLIFPKVDVVVNSHESIIIEDVEKTVKEIKRKVLYIEDNLASRELVILLIEDYPGIELFTANTAEQGITIAREQLPDLLIIDINLPEMSGNVAVKILKDDAKLSHAKFYALSADVLPEQIDKAMAAGFDHYLTKPIEINALVEIIENIA